VGLCHTQPGPRSSLSPPFSTTLTFLQTSSWLRAIVRQRAVWKSKADALRTFYQKALFLSDPVLELAPEKDPTTFEIFYISRREAWIDVLTTGIAQGGGILTQKIASVSKSTIGQHPTLLGGRFVVYGSLGEILAHDLDTQNQNSTAIESITGGSDYEFYFDAMQQTVTILDTFMWYSTQ
jgi:hypothetical protein